MSKRRLGWILSLVPVVVVVLAASVNVLVQSSGDIEWTTYGGDLASTRYSPADQIDASNFGDLEIAWRLTTHNFGPTPEYNFQSTPLMVGGVIYTTAGTRRAVLAADATTGELLWIASSRRGRPWRRRTASTFRSRTGLPRRWRLGTDPLCHSWLHADLSRCRPLDSRRRVLATRASST